MSTRDRPSPDELLLRVEAEERHHKRGRLKIFLGYASGVGKSFRMFDEGRRRKTRGQDVVVAAVQAGQPDTDTGGLLQGFESIAQIKGALDVAAIRRRHPAICLVDGLAHRNPPGSRHEERWQDVEELLEAGIGVITTINLQYVRERQAQVEGIRGKRVTDSVPEAFLRQADDIEVVDAPAEYCVGRAGAGDAGLEQQLSELREIALLLAAEVVDAQLDKYLHRHGLAQSYGTQERVLVCVTPRSNAELMIARGRRQADRFHGELFVGYYAGSPLGERDQLTLERFLERGRASGAQVHRLEGEDFVSAALAFCAKYGVTQIFVGHTQRRSFWQRLLPNPVERLMMDARGIDIRVFPNAASSRE